MNDKFDKPESSENNKNVSSSRTEHESRASTSRKSNVDISIEDVMNKIGNRITTLCEKQEKTLCPKDHSYVGKCISDYMVENLQDTKRSTAHEIAKLLCNKYPKSFCIEIGDAMWSNGVSNMLQRIQNGVGYRISRKRKATNDEDSDDEHVKTKRKKSALKLKQDQYGCVEYEPALPRGETMKSQEEKRKEILHLLNSGDVNADAEAHINQLMQLIYSTLRKNINREPRDLKLIFEEWPLLKKPEYIFDHASRLLGKNVLEQWNTSLASNSKHIRRYFLAKVDQIEDMKTTFEECKVAVQLEKNITPKILVIFPLILKYFKEDPKSLYKFVDKNVDNSSISSVVINDCPILIMKGDSLYDGNAECTFVLNRNIEIHCRTALEGILITFLSYYVFGLCYNVKVKWTLEFIQRVLMKINPSTGQKTTAKKSDAYDTKVFDFAAALAKSTNEFDLSD